MKQPFLPWGIWLLVGLSSCGGSSGANGRNLMVKLRPGQSQLLTDPAGHLSLHFSADAVDQATNLSVSFDENWPARPRGEHSLELGTVAAMQAENLPERLTISWPAGRGESLALGLWSTDGLNWVPEVTTTKDGRASCQIELSNQDRSAASTLYLGQASAITGSAERQPLLKVLAGFASEGSLDSDQEAVVLVHGLHSSARAMKPLADALVPEGFQVAYGWQYDWTLSIEQNGRLFADLLKTLPPGKKVSLVGHSMGTMVCRSAIEQFKASNQVKLLVGLGAPNQGSPLAKTADLCRSQWWHLVNDPLSDTESWLGVCSPTTPSVQQLQPGSSFLTSLNQRQNQLNRVPYLMVSGNSFSWGGPFGPLLKWLYFPGVETDGIVAVDSASGGELRDLTHGITKSAQLHQNHFELVSDPAAFTLIRAFAKEVEQRSAVTLVIEVDNRGRAGETGWDCRLRLANRTNQDLIVDRVISLLYDRAGNWVATQWLVLLNAPGFFPYLPTDFYGPDGLELAPNQAESFEFFTWFDKDQGDYQHSNSSQHTLSLIMIVQGRNSDGEQFSVSLSQSLLDQDGSGPTVSVRSAKPNQVLGVSGGKGGPKVAPKKR